MAVATTSSTALAQSQTGRFDTLVSRLANRFGVPEDEVQQVFDEVHAEHQSQMQTMFEERLNEQVSTGEITEDQKQAILDKKEEMIAFHETLRDLSPEERKAAFEEHRSEMKAWMEANGLEHKHLGL
jgi:DNA-directed RNA polymerase specialized sigma subunit